MSLVPASFYQNVDIIRDVKFNMKPTCSICMEEFDANSHIPKVLICGHSFLYKKISKKPERIKENHQKS